MAGDEFLMTIVIESSFSWEHADSDAYGMSVTVPSDKENCVILATHTYSSARQGRFIWKAGIGGAIDLTELTENAFNDLKFGFSHIYDPDPGTYILQSTTPGVGNTLQSGAWIVLSGVRNASHTFATGQTTNDYVEGTASPDTDGILVVTGSVRVVNASGGSLRSGSLIGLWDTNVTGHRCHGGAAYALGISNPVTAGINWPSAAGDHLGIKISYEPERKGGEGVPIFF